MYSCFTSLPCKQHRMPNSSSVRSFSGDIFLCNAIIDLITTTTRVTKILLERNIKRLLYYTSVLVLNLLLCFSKSPLALSVRFVNFTHLAPVFHKILVYSPVYYSSLFLFAMICCCCLFFIVCLKCNVRLWTAEFIYINLFFFSLQN